MSNHYATADRVALVGAAFAPNGTTPAVWASGKPAHVRRAVYAVITASDAAQTVTVALRNKDDSSSVTLGSFVIASGTAVNTVVYADIGARQEQTTLADGTIRYESGNGEIKVMPYQELVFTSDGGGTTGTGDLYVEYSEGGQEIYDAAYVEAVWTVA